MDVNEALKKIESKMYEILNEKLMEGEEKKKKKMSELREMMEARWERRKKELEQKINAEISVIRGRILSDAKMKAKMSILEAREEVLNEVKRIVIEKLENIPKQKYATYIAKTLKEASTIIGMNVTIKCSAKDLNVVKQISSVLLPNSKVEVSDRIKYGGIIITSLDEKMIMDRTFDSLLESRWPEFRKIASKILFEEV